MISNTKIFSHEDNNVEYMKRFNIINVRKIDASKIFCIDMDKNEEYKIDYNRIFSGLKNKNLLFNFIYTNDIFSSKIVKYRRIFINEPSHLIKDFSFKEIALVSELYVKVIKDYLNKNIFDMKNQNKFEKTFTDFDKKYGYSEKVDSKTKKTTINSNLRKINKKFNFFQFFLKYYSCKDLSNLELDFYECLCYLNLIFYQFELSLLKINTFISKKEKIFKSYNYLSNKDKLLIMINLLHETINPKSQYTFRSFYDCAENSPYIKSELFYRNVTSKLK